MKLTLKLKKPINDSFIHHWLVPAISRFIRKEIYLNKKLLSNINQIELKDLIDASNSIIVSHLYNDSKFLLISIDPNKRNSRNTAKLYDICALVNFGSLQTPACPIFTKTFDYFAKNFQMFYENY